MGAETGPLRSETLAVSQRLALAGLTIYKIVLSPLFPGTCRFLPSCSQYAREAITVHGTSKGCWLTLRRLSRCHPFGSSGLDPVPGRAPRTSTPGL